MTARVRLFWAARDGSIVDDDRKQKTDAPGVEIRTPFVMKAGGGQKLGPQVGTPRRPRHVSPGRVQVVCAWASQSSI